MMWRLTSRGFWEWQGTLEKERLANSIRHNSIKEKICGIPEYGEVIKFAIIYYIFYIDLKEKGLKTLNINKFYERKIFLPWFDEWYTNFGMKPLNLHNTHLELDTEKQVHQMAYIYIHEHKKLRM